MDCKKTTIKLRDGTSMPKVGYGTWQSSDPAALETALNVALEAGYRHIDTAFIYQNEDVVGKVVNEWISSGKLKRSDIYITTKLPIFGVNPDLVEFFMKKSLDNLKLDYVDMYLVHFSVGVNYKEGDNFAWTNTIPTDHIAIWKKMEEQVDAGRTKSIGLSNFNIAQIDRVLKNSRIKPANLQVELHVYLQQKELVKFCHDNDIGVVAYSPLGAPGHNDFLKKLGAPAVELPNILNDPVILKIAKKHKKSAGHVLLRFLIQNDIVVIPKSVTPSRVKDNINLFDFKLDCDDMKEIAKLDKGEEARVAKWDMLIELKEHPEYPFPK